MSVHFGLNIESKKSLQQLECFSDRLLGDAMVLDIEETTFMACFVDIAGNGLALR